MVVCLLARRRSCVLRRGVRVGESRQDDTEPCQIQGCSGRFLIMYTVLYIYVPQQLLLVKPALVVGEALLNPSSHLNPRVLPLIASALYEPTGG